MFFAIFTAKSDQEFTKKLRSGKMDQLFFFKALIYKLSVRPTFNLALLPA